MGQSSECQSNLALLSELEKDNFLEVLFNGSPDMIALLAADFTIRMANRTLINQIGLTAEQVIGSSGKTVLPGLHKQLDYLFQKSCLTKQAARSKFNFQLTDGNGRNVTYWKVFLNPLFEEQQFNGWLMVLKETTRQVVEGIKRSEESKELKIRWEKLQAAEKKFDAFNELFPFGIWECNREGEVVDVNEAFLKTTGMSHEDSLGLGWAILAPEAEREQIITGWQACFGQEAEWEYPYQIRDLSGEIRHIQAQGIPVRDADGEIQSWLIMNQKISSLPLTGQQTVSAITADESSFYQSIVNNVPVALAIYAGENMDLCWSNSAYQRFLELSERARIEAGALVENHLPYTDNLLFDEVFYQVIVEQKPSSGLAVQLSSDPGSQWLCSVVPLSGSTEGCPDVMVIAIAHPVSETEATVETQAPLADSPIVPNERMVQLEKLEAIWDNLAEGFMVFNLEGNLLQSNRTARMLLGINPEVEDPQAVLETVSDSQLYCYYADGKLLEHENWPHQRLIRGEHLEMLDLEVRITGNDQSRLLSYSGSMFRELETEQCLAVLAFRDISVRRAVEREKEQGWLDKLRYQQQHSLEKLLDTTSFGIAVVDGPEYRIKLANQYYQNITGFQGDITNRRLTDLFPAKLAEEMIQQLDEVRWSGHSVKVTACGYFNKTALQDQYWEFEYLPLKSTERDLNGILIVAADISDWMIVRKRNEYLAAMLLELNNADSMVDILKTAVQYTVQALNANDGGIYLFNEEDGEFQVVYELWLDESTKRNIYIDEMPNTKEALTRKTPIYFSALEAAGKEIGWFQQSGMAGCLAIPLVWNQSCIGLMLLYYVWQDLQPTAEEREFAASIAEKCTLVIERANTQMEKTRVLTSERRGRNQAERQVIQLSALLQSLHDGVVVFDNSGNIVLRNQMERRISQIEDQEALSVLQYGDFRWLTLDGAPLSPHQLPGSRLLRGETIDDTEYILEYPDGARLRVINNGSVVRGEDGKVMLCIMVNRDVTQIRLLEEVREDFIRAVSHDLRNPLTVVSARSQLLHRRLSKLGLTGEAEEVEVIYISARRMTQMIQEIFDSYRLESSNFKLVKKVIDLSRVMQELGPRIGTEEDQSRIRLEIPPGDYRIYADQEQLERAIINLIANGLKYSPADNPVIVCLTTDGKQHYVTVTDFGMGIAPQDISKVFQRYYRSAAVKESVGMGLGLYMVKVIVEAHGGSVDVNSLLNEGSTFRLSLPVVAPEDDPNNRRS